MAAKIIVEVLVRFDTHGKMTPLEIVWEDRRRFEIDRVLDVRQAPSLKAGGQGLRFTCRIEEKERYLFFEEPFWFVEGK